MLFTVDLVNTFTGVFPVMSTNVGTSCFRLAVLAIALSSSFPGTLALPAIPPLPNISPIQVNASSLSTAQTPRPPQEPTCPSGSQWGATLGHPSYDDCDYILSNLYPKDPLSKPVTRNFYVANSDVSHTMSNFRLPYEESYRTCNIQLLLATDFNHVPHDEATWNELRGVARTILRTCIRGKGFGGVVPRNGKNGNIEIVVYGKNSIFAKNQILKNSPDPLARSIAAQELLELIGLAVPVPTTGYETGAVAGQTGNVTVAIGSLADAGTSVGTS